jgi:hypothetical protein
MKDATQRYRGFDIAKVPCSMAQIDGRTYVVMTWRGQKLSKHSCLRDAKAEIDRLLKGSEVTDASEHGCPI